MTHTKTQHTPGPWEVGRGMYRERTNDYPPVVTHEARDVCIVESYYHDAEANARLIAAAPTMKGELEATLADVREALNRGYLPPETQDALSSRETRLEALLASI